MKEFFLPYFMDRTENVDMLVFHCSAFSADKVLYYLNEYKCSCHYLIDENAEVIKVVDESKAAQHAGMGYWRGFKGGFNNRSIGIEICNMSLGQEAYDEKQIDVLSILAQDIIQRYNILPQNVVGHSDIAPLRKADPGKAFPWQKLANQGVGLWYNLSDAQRVSEKDVLKLLASIGYDVSSLEAVQASAYAFCRRFLPKYVKTDKDIAHLVDNILPDDFNFMLEEDFLTVLKAVSYCYK